MATRTIALALALLLASVCSVHAAIDRDERTLLLLHFDNDLKGIDGEVPLQSAAVSFETGIVGQGVLIDREDTLSYATSGNFSPSSGTIEFWIKPRWNGNDNLVHYFLGIGDQLQLVKDGANNIRFILRLDDSEAYRAYNTGAWTAGEWHHIAVTWAIPGQMKIFIDGIERVSHPASDQDLISSLPPGLSIGSRNNTSQADAIIDELRISDVARSAREIGESFLSELTISALTIKPVATEMFLTWKQTPKVEASTNLGNVEIPVRAANLSSSNRAIASVSESGIIEALSAGTATITARIGAMETATQIRVKATVRPPEHETIDPYLATPAQEALYVVPVVIIRYLPTTDGVNLDVAFNPDFYTLNPISLVDLKTRINTFARRVKFMLEEGSRFRGYKDSLTRPSIGYKVIDQITVFEPTPPGEPFVMIKGLPVHFHDFNQIFSRFNAEHYVNDLGVREFWLWESGLDPGYPSYDPSIHKPENFRIGNESNMSSPTTGDISNSFRDNTDLPIYNKTYVVYGQNFRRTQAEAVHNHGHQLEAMLSHVNFLQDRNTTLFWKKFVGQDESNRFITGRCGWTHMPPNTTQDYDYQNTTLVESDIEDWTPEGTGQRKPVNALTWGDILYPWPDAQPIPQKTESQWYIYWMQSMPGRGNQIPYAQNRMTNWWHFTADWDASIRAGLGLYEPASCNYSLSATSQSFAAEGGADNVQVFAGGCKWIAASNASWISITSENTSSNGNSVVSFSVAANTSRSPRTGTIAIANQVFTVTQPRRSPELTL